MGTRLKARQVPSGSADFVDALAMIKVMDPAAMGAHVKAGIVETGGSRFPGIWLSKDIPDVTNYAFLGNGTETLFNSVGNMSFRISNATKFQVNTAGNVIAANLASGVTAPVTTGTVRRVVADSAGLLSTVVEDKHNAAVLDQTINAATTALLTGSLITIPDGALKVGSIFRFTVALSKTAAGTVASTFLFKIGTAGTAADATILTFTTAVGTAVVDTGLIDIVITIRAAGTTAAVSGNFKLAHNGNLAGLVNIPNNVLNAAGTVNTTLTGLKASLTCTTGAATVFTFQQVVAETINL